eukprot:c26856_g1_i1 orf=63-1520(+)
MAAPRSNSLSDSSGLLCVHSPPQPPSSEHDSGLHLKNLLPLQPSACLDERPGEFDPGICDACCQQPLRQCFLTDFQPSCGQVQQSEDLSFPVVGGRVHKADREKQRRDKLNRQFSELARVLDPVRPKIDKATILVESLQALKDLHTEVKQLKEEHIFLLKESHDLTQEKNELREEKLGLKNETQQLQIQLQRYLHAMPPWVTLDRSVMGAAAFPYPVPVPQPVSLPSPDSHQALPLRSFVSPMPYSLFPPSLGAFPMLPGLQPHAMGGGKHGDGNNPYLPYPSFPPPVSSHSHVERPCPQYPSLVQPTVGYSQIHCDQGSRPQISVSVSGTPVHKLRASSIPLKSIEEVHSSGQELKAGNCSHDCPANSQHVATDLQLQISPATLICQSQASGSPVVNGSESKAAASKIRVDTDSASCQQKINCLAPSTTNESSKEGLHSEFDEARLLLGFGENRNLEHECTGSRESLETVPQQSDDLVLWAPAA